MASLLILALCLVAYCVAFGLGFLAATKRTRRVPGMLRRRENGDMIGVAYDGLTLMDFPPEEPPP